MDDVPPDDVLRVPLKHLHTLSAGTRLFRVHPSAYKPFHGKVRFNNSSKGDARFSPLQHNGIILPTIYAALTFECALMESVFHDVAPRMGVVLHPGKLNGLVCTAIKTVAELRLLDLTSVGLRRFDLQVTDVIDTFADQYLMTRRLALALYKTNPAAHGLYWTSRLDNRSQALLLFGDREGVKDSLQPVGRSRKLQRPSGGPLLEVLTLAEKIGVDITG